MAAAPITASSKTLNVTTTPYRPQRVYVGLESGITFPPNEGDQYNTDTQTYADKFDYNFVIHANNEKRVQIRVDSVTTRKIFYDSQGRKILEMMYRNEVKHGNQYFWSPGTNRKVFVDTYDCGKPTRRIEYFINGKLFYEYVTIKDDVKVIHQCNPITMRDDVLGEGEITVWKAGRASIKNKYVGVYIEIICPKESRRVTPMFQRNNNARVTHAHRSRIEHGIVKSITDEYGNHYQAAVSVMGEKERLTCKEGEIIKSASYVVSAKVCEGSGIYVHKFKEDCYDFF